MTPDCGSLFSPLESHAQRPLQLSSICRERKENQDCLGNHDTIKKSRIAQSPRRSMDRRIMEQDMTMSIGNNTNTAPQKFKFKGVVPQTNDRWGAQIYVNTHRVWLGTFRSEIEAAMAYDSASIKLRPGDIQRNFPRSDITNQELNFQSHYSADEILKMIRSGTYPTTFSEFNRTHMGGENLSLSSIQDYSGFSCKLLFQKELTPSDVGKLNRLVVPKKYAEKYFPTIDNGKENIIEEGDKSGHEEHLVFYDRMRRQWKFRYCYWQSSQSFVFTRGWNKFVKENKLKANDTIAFYVCESRERMNEGRASYFLIDIGCPEETTDVRVAEKEIDNVDTGVDLSLRLGQEIVKEEEDELVEDQVVAIFDEAIPDRTREDVRVVENISENVDTQIDFERKKKRQRVDDGDSETFEATSRRAKGCKLFGVWIN